MKKVTTLFVGALTLLATLAQAQDCPTTATLTAPLSGAKVVEQASKHLTAANLVQSGEVAYRAGQSVTLTAGFEVKPGAVFEATIAPCKAVDLEHKSWGDNVFALGSYPNPFAQNTLIEYTIPDASTVSVSIIDLRGVTISRLLINQEQSEGTHRLTFESDSLPEGVYICTLTTPNGRKTHKIIKQK